MENHPKNPNIQVLSAMGAPTDTVACYSSVGCYPVSYTTKSNDTLCGVCVEDDIEACTDPDDDSWIVSHEANWEDTSLHCSDCGDRIESAYKDDDCEVCGENAFRTERGIVHHGYDMDSIDHDADAGHVARIPV